MDPTTTLILEDAYMEGPIEESKQQRQKSVHQCGECNKIFVSYKGNFFK